MASSVGRRTYNTTIARGSHFRRVFKLQDADTGLPSTPLTGYTARMQVRTTPDYTGHLLMTLDSNPAVGGGVGNGRIEILDLEAMWVWKLTEAEVALIDWDVAFYTFYLYDAAGVPVRMYKGTLYVSADTSI